MSPAPERIGPIPRGVFMREFGGPGRPCILVGAMDRWRARSWTFDWLRTEHGHVRFPVGKSYSRVWAPTEMTLREYLDAILATRGPQELYLASVEFLDRLPSLRHDFEFPDYTWWERAENTLLFIGGAGARSPLHFDFSHTLLAQVVGRKRFRFFSPDQTPRLDPLPRELFQTFSGLGLEPSGEAGRERPKLDFVLQPGEILFLPHGWWHAVDSLEPTVSITRSWWTSRMFLSEAPRVVASWIKERVRAGIRG
jgi:hypothetical protein